jgi:hypothetical protein
MWAIVMDYKCNCCDFRVAGNAGELLILLPPHFRDVYPVHPICTDGNFHLSKTKTDILDDVIARYGNGNYFSRSLCQRLNLVHYRYINKYYKHCTFLGLPKVNDYPDLTTWIGQFYPDGAKFWASYEKAQESTSTHTGYSKMEWYTWELQSVECNLISSSGPYNGNDKKKLT